MVASEEIDKYKPSDDSDEDSTHSQKNGQNRNSTYSQKSVQNGGEEKEDAAAIVTEGENDADKFIEIVDKVINKFEVFRTRQGRAGLVHNFLRGLEIAEGIEYGISAFFVIVTTDHHHHHHHYHRQQLPSSLITIITIINIISSSSFPPPPSALSTLSSSFP